MTRFEMRSVRQHELAHLKAHTRPRLPPVLVTQITSEYAITPSIFVPGGSSGLPMTSLSCFLRMNPSMRPLRPGSCRPYLLLASLAFSEWSFAAAAADASGAARFFWLSHFAGL